MIKNIKIFDVIGKEVRNVNPKNDTTTIDASALSDGTYFAKILTEDHSETIKLIKN